MAKHATIATIDSHLGYWLRFVSNHVSHTFSQRLLAFQVTVAEWVFLRELFDYDSLQPSQIATRLGMTRGAISKLATRLATKELILCTDGSDDLRTQHVALSARGRDLVPRLAAIADLNDDMFFGALSHSQRTQLMKTLRHLVDHHHFKQVPIA